MAAPTRIWIETTDEHDALCMLGALSDYRARLARRGDKFVVEVSVDRELDALMRAVHRAVRNCVSEDGAESVVFRVNGREYPLTAA